MYPKELLNTILSKIKFKQNIRYIPFGDGEQNYSIFTYNLYPFILVNKDWNYIMKNLRNIGFSSKI